MKLIFKWLELHAVAIQATIGIMTLFVGLGALAGVKLQLMESERLQKEQSARDIYKDYLSLSLAQSEFANPDYCAIKETPKANSYNYYLEYYLYTNEQLMEARPDWSKVFDASLHNHAHSVCSFEDWSAYSPKVQSVIGAFRAKTCATLEPCLATQ